mmetsp:Transcript_1815/g.2500  ORF Transcript_1815/g.2500 Transcript_1815/m.2500 type:complete len:385 (-) Transcript_1815:40-1194(-)
MKDCIRGSIHDIGAAPDAPDVSSLINDVGSGNSSSANSNSPGSAAQSSWENTLSSSFLRSNQSIPPLNDDDAPNTPRERINSDGAMSGSDSVKRKISDDSFSEFMMDDNVDNRNLSVSNREPAMIERKPRVIWLFSCIPFPLCWNYRPKWTKYAAVLVRNAPCFWFCFPKLEVGATDRSVIYRLNLLCAVFALIEIAFAGYVLIMLYWPGVDRTSKYTSQNEEGAPSFLTLWSINTFSFVAGILACVIFIVEISTLRLIREVNLQGAIWYYGVLGWFLPLQAIVAFGLFDFFKSNDIWIKHWWSTASMGMYRQQYCQADTHNTRCVVPIDGGLNTTELQWCIDNFNMTDCTQIRETAQEGVRLYSTFFFTVFGGKNAVLINFCL